MNTNSKKTVYCIVAATAFVFIAAGSAKINKIHCGAFTYNSTGEEKESRNYVVLNDGSKIFGDKISWKTGILVKDQIRVDDEKYKIRDTKGYFYHGTYYGRYGNSYVQRIIHGKLNVYYSEETVTNMSTNPNTGATRTTMREVCGHYVQVGDDGELNPIGSQNDIKQYVKDCPKSLEMISKKDKEIRRAIRRNAFYLNRVFIIYNNNCQE